MKGALLAAALAAGPHPQPHGWAAETVTFEQVDAAGYVRVLDRIRPPQTTRWLWPTKAACLRRTQARMWLQALAYREAQKHAVRVTVRCEPVARPSNLG